MNLAAVDPASDVYLGLDADRCRLDGGWRPWL